MGLIQGGSSEYITIAGRVILASRLKVLTASADVAKYQTARENGQNYCVPAGKKLKILAMKAFNNGASESNNYIGFSSVAGDNSATMPTGGQFFGNGFSSIFGTIVAKGSIEIALSLEIPEGKYPLIYIGGAHANIYLYCVEE